MPARARSRRMPDCFSRVSGMNGCAAAWPMRWRNGTTRAWLVATPGSSDSRGANRLRSLSPLSEPLNCTITKYATAATTPNTQRMKAIWSMCVRLHLDRGNPPDRVHAQHLKREREGEQLVARRRRGQRMGVLGVHKRQEHEHHQRERDEH